MPKETSAGAVIFRREPAHNVSQAKRSEAGEPTHNTSQAKHNEAGKVYYLFLRHKTSRPGKNREGRLDFPKGHIEEGETEEQTVRREVKEETGIEDLKIIPGFKQWIKYYFKPVYGLKEEEKKKAPLIFKIVTYYLAQTKAKEIKISSEHIGFIWLSYENALKQLRHKNAKKILKRANEFLSSRKSL